jgi:hypothetical protein
MQTDRCRMNESLGEIESCPGALCPFWEEGSCAFRSLEFRGQPELAGYLLQLRGELESARAREDANAARRLFFHRLNAGRSD